MNGKFTSRNDQTPAELDNSVLAVVTRLKDEGKRLLACYMGCHWDKAKELVFLTAICVDSQGNSKRETLYRSPFSADARYVQWELEKLNS